MPQHAFLQFSFGQHGVPWARVLVRGSEATLRGAVSGRVYQFAHSGARLRVDPRDEGGLLQESSLRSVRERSDSSQRCCAPTGPGPRASVLV